MKWLKKILSFLWEYLPLFFILGLAIWSGVEGEYEFMRFYVILAVLFVMHRDIVETLERVKQPVEIALPEETDQKKGKHSG